MPSSWAGADCCAVSCPLGGLLLVSVSRILVSTAETGGTPSFRVHQNSDSGAIALEFNLCFSRSSRLMGLANRKRSTILEIVPPLRELDVEVSINDAIFSATDLFKIQLSIGMNYS